MSLPDPDTLLESILPQDVRSLSKPQKREWWMALPRDEQQQYMNRVEELLDAAIEQWETQQLEMRRKYQEDVQRIRDQYQPLHPHLYTFSESFVEPTFLAALREGSREALMRALTPVREETRLYSLRPFTEQFCRELLEEVRHFNASGLTVQRPNSMNRYGVVLDDIGMRECMNQLMATCVRPLAQLLYGDRGGQTLDSHHAFVIEYEQGKDEHLDFHTDDSEVTLNLCLGEEFTGAEVYFRGIRGEPSEETEDIEVRHEVGQAILHLGAHRHGTKRLTSGRRVNFVLWCRSSEYRAAQDSCECGEDHGEEGGHHGHHHGHGHDEHGCCDHDHSGTHSHSHGTQGDGCCDQGNGCSATHQQ